MTPGGDQSRVDEEFYGHDGRYCGEHRTLGARAWCYDCSQYCYRSDGCDGCRRPQEEAEHEALQTRALTAEQALERADELARAVAKEWLLPSNSSERLREAAQSYLASRALAPSEEDGE